MDRKLKIYSSFFTSEVQKDLTANLAVVLGMYETGLAVGRSLGRAGIRVLGLDSSEKVGFFSRYIKCSICPHPIEHEKDFIDFLIRIAAREKMHPLLFITSDEFIISVSRNRKEIEKYYLINLPDSEVIECISDKYKQYGLALSANIPVPKTFCVSNMDQLVDILDEIPMPAFIKGADVTTWRKKIGVARKGFTVIKRDELINICRVVFEQRVRCLIQELIEGPDTCHYKVSCYLSKKGEVLLAFCLQKIRQQPVNYGFGCLVQSIEYPELLKLGKTFFTRIRYRGVGSAEFKLDQRDGKLKLIELNPRYWQQNALADRCGMNFPLMNYLDLIGNDPKPVSDYRDGVKWINIYSDVDSFREYRQRGQLTFMQWLLSLRGEKMFSDLSSDDILPGVHEMLIGNILHRTGRFIKQKFKYIY